MGFQTKTSSTTPSLYLYMCVYIYKLHKPPKELGNKKLVVVAAVVV